MNFGRGILVGLIGLPMLAAGIPAQADPAVRFEPAVMTPGAGVQYVEVSRHRRRHHRHRVVRRRSRGKSAAIVGGSAAGGAVIGALAGGGKGAAIGAVAGGAGGYIYDRKTHKKVVRE